MAEISREEAIIVLKCLATDILGENAKGWENKFVERSYYALDKAISDMEKLEKIEKVIDTTLIAKEPYKVKIETIEQILRGGE